MPNWIYALAAARLTASPPGSSGSAPTPALADVSRLRILPIIRSLAAHFQPTAYPLLPLLRSLSTALIATLSVEPERLDDALALACLLAVAVTRPGLYPAGHPARGVALAEFAKLLLVPPPAPLDSSGGRPSLLPDTLFRTGPPSIPLSPLGRLTMAREALLTALEELRVGFGKPDGGLVGREVAGLVEGVGREIQGLLASQRAI